jgi:hypothetical protein
MGRAAVSECIRFTPIPDAISGEMAQEHGRFTPMTGPRSPFPREHPAIDPPDLSEAIACVQHPDRGWPHDDCAGSGVPCEDPMC